MAYSTDDLLRELSTVSDMDAYFERHKDDLLSESFAVLLHRHIDASGLSLSDVAQAAEIDRYYLYEILRGEKQPTTDRIVCLGLALSLGFEKTQQLLKVAGRPLLYAKRPRDSRLIFALHQQKTVAETNAWLESAGEPCLGQAV